MTREILIEVKDFKTPAIREEMRGEVRFDSRKWWA